MSKLLIYIPFFWNYLLIKLCNGKFNSFPKISGFIFVSGRKGTLEFGERVVINSSKWANPVGLASQTRFRILQGASIKIGNNVGISSSIFVAHNSIVIEDNVNIGGGCQLLDNDFHSLDPILRLSEQDQAHIASSPIHIKNNAFIGTQCIILKGVTIGCESIVAAGSIVTKSIPDREVWGGNPARFIRRIRKEI
ncbi:acyltransferase [Dyadobacter pollutisoli]|jgi:acetyltransferase-like isoleucine patch superfamily enzyme|uniref:Acyltransferase n=1 Tax=Dyadobacter pollutisoli TaxID=2910158 RepID=A0A9E8NBC1_9BACT|nr:acyltransferase [Dyadobacter pollutisoli]WAC11917.1 acyltransferase [Dyadobacter pollutisoli]